MSKSIKKTKPKNPFKSRKVKELNHDDEIVEMDDAGIPGLFQPQQCDIDEILENNEAFREHRRNAENI